MLASVVWIGIPLATMYFDNVLMMCSCGRSIPGGKAVSSKAAIKKTVIHRWGVSS